MTRDQILDMARKSGMSEAGIKHLLMVYEAGFSDGVDRLEQNGWRHCAFGQRTTQYCGMAEQARSEERERCAKLLELDADGRGDTDIANLLRYKANLIRAGQ